ncbi:hypothetical protein [Lacinutrix chionoecetis]
MKRILFSLCIIAFALSCTSDNDTQEPTQQPPESNFYALTVGNAWVYKNYKYNVNIDTYEETSVIDSISIVGTENFNGETYFKFRRLTTGNQTNITFCNPNGEHFEFLREVEGDLIDNQGNIKFTNNDYNERLLSEQSWGNIMEILVHNTTDLTVEAGIFTCINSERYAIFSDGTPSPSLDRFYYSDGIGLVYDTTSFVTSDIPSIIRRLDAYSIQ